MTRRFWQVSLGVGLGAALLVTAYLLINTNFMYYDDEGYLLLTYKNFIAGGRLYDDIFSQYGPWPYLYHQVITTVLHRPLTHALGRDLTALHWVLCALLSGAIAARATGRTIPAVCTTLMTFSLLWQMNSEPSHPGSMIAALLAVAAVVTATTHGAGRWKWLGVGVGLVTALLVLTKINIGLLFVAGAGAAALRFTAWPERWRRPADVLAAVGLLAVPWGLMHSKLGNPWALGFAIQFTLAAAGLLWVTPTATTRREIPPRTWIVAAGTFVVVLVTASALVCSQGTSVRALVQTVLVDPLRQPASFMLGFTWVPLTWPVATVCWLATAWAGWELRHRGEVGPVVRCLLIALRLATAAAFVLHAESWLTIHGVARFIVFCLPLLPVFLAPLGHRTVPPDGPPGISPWVAFLALPQVLHAFPVAGSQMGWGTFLVVPVLIAGLNEAGLALVHTLPRIGRWLPRIGWGLLLLVSASQLGLVASNGWERYRLSKPLGLPGAEDIRLDGGDRLSLRVLTMNAAVHADLLFSRPGMFSYNLWSGVPTPTRQNATHWFWLLTDDAQARIVEKLRASPRTAIITSQVLDDYVMRLKVPSHGPLQPYIAEHYRTLINLDNLRFLVPAEARAVPFGKVDVLASAQPLPDGNFPALLRTNVVLDGQPVTIQLQGLRAPWPTLVDYTNQKARIFLEPITAQGDILGAAIPLPAIRPVKGLFRLTILAAHTPNADVLPRNALVVRAPDGSVLSESIFFF